MSQPSRRRIGAAATALGLLLTGCTATPKNLSDDWSVEAALRQVPGSAQGEHLMFQAADVDQALKAAGLERGDGADDTLTWMKALSNGKAGSTVYVPLLPPLDQLPPDAAEGAVGFGLGDVSAFAGVVDPPHAFTAYFGDDLAPEVLPDSLTDLGEGVWTDSDRPDGEAGAQGDPLVDQLGRPTRFAARDGAVAVTLSTDTARDWLKGGDGLAGDESALALAKALDRKDALSAVISRASTLDPSQFLGANADPAQAAQLLEELTASQPETPFDAVALGWAEDTVLVAYRFTGDADAEALERTWRDAVSPLTRRPVSEAFTVQDVTVDEGVGLVELTPAPDAPSNLIMDWLTQREPVLSSR